MQVKNTLINLVVATALLLPLGAAAQSGSINAFSPYTMYGIGEPNTPGTLPMRSMGGVGVAMRSAGTINLLNPAGFSAIPQKSVLFDFGLEAQNYYNSQQLAGVTKRSAYNTINFHDIALLMPLAKRVGLGLSVTPYSSVGYRIEGDQPYDPSDPVWGNVGRVQYRYSGEGDLTEIKLGVGWEVFKNFSVGAAAQFYWGDIDRSFTMSPTVITGSGSTVEMAGTSTYSVASFKGQVGVQWDVIKKPVRILTLGASFDFGGDLNPKVSNIILLGDMSSTVVQSLTEHLPVILPHQVQAGFFYQTTKWVLGADYVYQNWGGRNTGATYTGVYGSDRQSFRVAYTDTHTVKAGVQFTPNHYDVRRFYRRWAYRAGVRAGRYNQTFGDEHLMQYAASFGIGIPVRQWSISAIDVGVEYGTRGGNVAKRVGLVRQQYVKFSLGFALFAGAENNEYWFLRPKYD